MVSSSALFEKCDLSIFNEFPINNLLPYFMMLHEPKHFMHACNNF